MRDELSAVPEAVEAAWGRARRFDLASKYADIFGVVIVGGGAAGAAAAMCQAVVAHTAQIPVIAVPGELLPAFVGPDHLVIACDAGEGTPETLALFEEAADRGAKLVIVAPGDQWVKRAMTHRTPSLPMPDALAAPWMVGPLLVTLIAVLDAAQVINGVRDVDVAAAVVELKTLRDASAQPGDDPVSPNLAQQIARQVAGRLISLEALGVLAPVAIWGRARLADGANALTLADEAGSVLADVATETRERGAVIALRSPFDPPTALARARAAVELRSERDVTGAVIPVSGAARITQTLWAVHLLDWVTHYLAVPAAPA